MDVPFKMAAIDLDGTLLGPDGKVGSRNRAAVRALSQAGVVSIIASGRMHAATQAIHDDLGLDTPVVSYNGAMVLDPVSGEMLSHHPLDAEIAMQVVRWAQAEGLHLNYYLNDRLFVEKEDRWSDMYHARTGSIIEPVGPLTRFDGERPTKIILVAEPEETLRWQSIWQERLGARAYLVRTMPEYLEFLNPDVDKWTGVQRVAERYGIDARAVAAFGDSPNDLPMLEGAGLGVVMPYAAPEVLDVADVIGEGGPEDAFGATVEALLDGRLMPAVR